MQNRFVANFGVTSIAMFAVSVYRDTCVGPMCCVDINMNVLLCALLSGALLHSLGKTHR